jgi:DNA-binding NarL/FixJ family response regulator
VTITLIIADDQPLMRSALRMCLSAEPDIEVIGEAADGLEVISMAQRLRPDVVIMDVRMPRLDGVAATRRLTSAVDGPPTKVLMITTFHLDEYVVEGLRAGATGFLLKDATAEELVQGVRIVAGGQALLSPVVTKRLLDSYARRLPAAGNGAPSLIQLTKREIDVLTLVAHGLTNTAIAEALCVAESSVKTHIRHLLAKLNLPHRVQLVIYAYDVGLIWPGAPVPGGLNSEPQPGPAADAAAAGAGDRSSVTAPRGRARS